MKWYSLAAVGLISTFMLLINGCGDPDTQSKVTGSVTFNGSPVPEGLMRFEPRAGDGTPRSQSVRDGKFEVRLDPGPYLVRVTAADREKMGPPPDDPNAAGPEFIALLPDQWNTSSEMVIEVESGDNTFDFEGDSGQPPAVKAVEAGGDAS